MRAFFGSHPSRTRLPPLVRPLVFLALVVACGSDPMTDPPAADAGEIVEAGPDAAIKTPPLPYPPGPYGIAFGEVMPDVKVQGYRMSSTERDSRKLPFEDIALSEVRSNPACKCMLVLWTSAGRGCPPCVEIAKTLATISAKNSAVCPFEILAFNFDAVPDELISLSDQPATRADLDAATLEGRQPFPVGIITGSVAATGLRAIPFVPGMLVMNANDMRIKDVLQGSGSIESRIRQACEGEPAAHVETLASAAVTPRVLALGTNRAFLATEEHGILALETDGATKKLSSVVPDLAGGTKVSSLTTDPSFLYWTTASAPYEIARVPLAGGARQVLSTGASAYTSIALDTAEIWFTRSDGTIGTIPRSGGPESSFATGENNPRSILVDDTNVYFIADDSLIVRAKSSGTRTVRATPEMLNRPNEGVARAVPVVLGQWDTSLLVEARIDNGTPLRTLNVILPKGDGPPTTWASLESVVAFAGADIYHAMSETQSKWSVIERVALRGEDQLNVGTLGQYDVSTLAIDGAGAWAYWTNRPLVNGAPGNEITLRRVKFR